DRSLLLEPVHAAHIGELESVMRGCQGRIADTQVPRLAPGILVVGDRLVHLERVGGAAAEAVLVHRHVAAARELLPEVVDRRRVAERVGGADAGVVVAAEAVLNEVVRDVDAAADGELVAYRLVEVEPGRGAPRSGVDLDALALLVVEPEVEARAPRAARGGEHGLVRRIGDAVQLLLPVVPLASFGGAVRGRDRVRLGSAAEPVLHGVVRAAVRFQVAAEVSRAQVLGHVLRAYALRDVETRRARLSLLGRDDHDTVGRTRTVDGAGRGGLEHLYALDVVRVDVRHAIDHLVLRGRRRAARPVDGGQPRGDRCVGNDDAVDHEERIAGTKDRGGAADLHLHAAARHAAVLHDRDTGDLARELLVDRFGWRGGDFLRGDRCDGRRSVALVDRRRLPGDRHALEQEHVPVEREVVRGRAGRDQHGLALVADHAHEDRHRLRWNAEPVAAVRA